MPDNRRMTGSKQVQESLVNVKASGRNFDVRSNMRVFWLYKFRVDKRGVRG